MAHRTAGWRLRTLTGQELTITAGDGRGGVASEHPSEHVLAGAPRIAYPPEFLRADLEAWLAGPDAWSRQALVEMLDAVGGDAAGAAIPALLEAFARGQLHARVRPPPAGHARAAEPAQPEHAEGGGEGTEAPPREQRRLSVRLGDLDAVFDPVGSVRGQKQRLQALGHYYERFTAATGGDRTRAFDGCLADWRAKRERVLGRPFADDAELGADMQDQVRRFVVGGGTLPAPGGEARIRLPGAVTVESLGELSDGGAPNGHPLPPVRFDRETAMWDGNGALGKIPIVVRVEVLRGGSWEAADGEAVCVQLVPPFYDDPGAELADVEGLRSTSQRPGRPLWPGGAAENAGPRQFIGGAIAHMFDEHDPQRYNAHQSRGGKRGRPVLGNIFDRLPAAGFPDMSAPEAWPAPRAHAVRVTTNAAGQAGVLFLPARTAGDRYRLRIFLDPNDGAPSDGTEPGAVGFETGRLCVWRHVLWSRHLAKPAPSYPAASSVAGVQARLRTLGYDVGEIDGDAGPRTREAVRAFQHAHHPLPANGDPGHAPTQDQIDRTVRDFIEGGESYHGFGPAIAEPRFATAVAELGRMYCELEVEPAGADGYQLTPERHRAALRWAIEQVQLAPPKTSAPRDVAAMFSEEFETPFLFEVRHPEHYNRLRRSGFPPARPAGGFLTYWQDAAALLVDYTRGLVLPFLRFLTGGYATPGLTSVTAMSESRLEVLTHEHGQVMVPIGNQARNSGRTFWDRASASYGGLSLHSRGYYRDDSFTKSILHEMGHQLLLRHQFAHGRPYHPFSFPEDHDSSGVVNPALVPAPVPYDRCLMGYAPCEGELCGKCHLKLRGWDISRMPT